MLYFHSVEFPRVVDPQWNIWYWASKWNLHTVCWGAVGCEWGTNSVYFGITYVCVIPSKLPVFVVEPQYRLQDFSFLSKVSFEGHIQNLLSFKNCDVGWEFGVTYATMLVTTQWPLKRADHLTSLFWVCVVWRPESLMELSALRLSWLSFKSRYAIRCLNVVICTPHFIDKITGNIIWY